MERIVTPPYLVQLRDEEGFWVNLHDMTTWKDACAKAQLEADARREQVRVVWGPKRSEPKYFEARPQR